jgi:hypothetical protein
LKVKGGGEVVPSTFDDVLICSTVVITVTLWVIFPEVEAIFGNMGIVGCVPRVCCVHYGVWLRMHMPLSALLAAHPCTRATILPISCPLPDTLGCCPSLSLVGLGTSLPWNSTG